MHPKNSLRPVRRSGRKAPLAEHQAYDLNHAFDYAVSLLARRDYSTRELKKKLAARGYTEHAYEVVVDDLESMGKISDERFGQNVVAYRARRGHGPARIRHELQKSGLSRSEIDGAVKGEDAPDFLALAKATRIRKFGPEIPKDRKERARQARFLQYRGFSNDHIRAALDGDPEVDDGAQLESE
ncbi:MAG TPA: regulatory protein RecX [Steroidobacteraceae bacterium]|jgi:regulatory protein|nr:regulatory protein RecX [Steroidobacteraceae bacterium]